MLCHHSLKQIRFHNFSSSIIMYILLNKYFCFTVFKKTWLLFWRVAVIPLHFCVYIWHEDMKCFYSNEMVKRSWSDSQSSSGDVVLVLMSSLRRQARFSICVCVCVCVCVVKEIARLCYPFIKRYDRVTWVWSSDRVNQWKMNRNDDSV